MVEKFTFFSSLFFMGWLAYLMYSNFYVCILNRKMFNRVTQADADDVSLENFFPLFLDVALKNDISCKVEAASEACQPCRLTS